MQKEKYFFIIILLASLPDTGKAHEPLYGLGPETLPRHLSTVESGIYLRPGVSEYKLGYGFGITENFTVRFDIPAVNDGSVLGTGNIRLRTKYAIWRKTEPGVLKRLTAIAILRLPTANNKIDSTGNTSVTLGLANGYESRRWYYFSDIGYTYIKPGTDIQPGAKIKYNLAGGIRPVRSDYLKPDLVILIELNGELRTKTHLNDAEVPETGGNTFAITSGFLLSYRNLMLKSGLQFGIANTQNVNRPLTNGLVSLEYHF